MINERKLTKSERKKREDIVMGMKKNKRDLVKRYGKDAEQVMYARAAKIAKNETKEKMKDLNITELIEDALKNPKKADLNKDGKLSDYEKKRGAAIEKAIEDKSIKEYDSLEDEAKRYYLYLLKIGKIDKLPDNPKEAFLIQMTKDQMEKDARKDRFERGLEEDLNIPLADIEEMGYEAGVRAFEEIKDKFMNAPDHKAYRDGFFKGWVDTTGDYGLNEDLDLGHEDNEPHMLKADLYRIGKYAMELYQMVDQFEYKGEVDFPHWWQSKVIKAKDMLVSAKHYLDFELKEPEIDALALEGKKGVNEAVTSDFEERIDQIVNHYFKGDQEVKKAAIEYASIKGARVMGGLSATASLFKDFYNNYSDEVANQAMEVIDMADDDVYFERKEGASKEEVIDEAKVAESSTSEEKAIKYFQQAIKLSHTNKVRNLILKAVRELGLEVPKVWTESVIDEANPDMADDDMFRFTAERSGDDFAVIDNKTGKVVKSGLGMLSATKLKDKLNNYTRIDVEGETPLALDVDTDVDPGEPLGLAEKLAKQLKEVKTDKYGNHLEPQFQVGEKVTYLGYPAEIVKINTEMDGGITYSLYYDKGNGKTKVTNIRNKGGAIEALK